MIPKNVRSTDLISKQVITDRDILTGAGYVIKKGTIVNVLDVARGFKLSTNECPCCGVRVIVRGVTRNDVSLVSEK